MNVGDAIEYEVDEDVLLIGQVTEVMDDAVRWIEAHAFHRVWGGSSAGRGKYHETQITHLKPAHSSYRHIVRDAVRRIKADDVKAQGGTVARDKGGWIVSVDGEEIGHIDDWALPISVDNVRDEMSAPTNP